MGEVNIAANIQDVLKRIDLACERRSKVIRIGKPILVAVSKTKPIEMIIAAYNSGQRHFGENYVQELMEKSQHPSIIKQCPQIKWHFIGHLQTNKINKILKLPNLYMIQTVDDVKLAMSINNALQKIEIDHKYPMKVLIQVNTSGEQAKNGASPNEVVNVYKYIKENLKQLQVDGIMTIGALGHDYSKGLNPDFTLLMRLHKQICEEQQLEPTAVQVSMGMSNDFENAVEMGSTIVRVGSSIFGERAKVS